MAQRIGKSEWKSLYPLRYIANLFKEQTLSQLEINMMTQRVFPYAPYSAYPEVNEYRRQHGGWYSKGEGIKSFEGTVYEANEKTGMVTMGFKFNDYMQYVDIGVGAGRKADDVERGRKVRFQNRYTTWNPSGGKSHRPAILPTLRHLATRLSDYTSDYLGTKAEYNIYETFEGLTIYI